MRVARKSPSSKLGPDLVVLDLYGQRLKGFDLSTKQAEGFAYS